LGCIPDDKKRATTSTRLLGARAKIKLHVRSNQIDAVVVRRHVVCEPRKKPPENRRILAEMIKAISATDRLVAFSFAG
jgi:hypothetical protein